MLHRVTHQAGHISATHTSCAVVTGRWGLLSHARKNSRLSGCLPEYIYTCRQPGLGLIISKWVNFALITIHAGVRLELASFPGHIPMPHSQVTFSGHNPMPHSHSTSPCHIPRSHSQVTIPGHNPIPHSQVTIPGYIPMSQSHATFPGHNERGKVQLSI